MITRTYAMLTTLTIGCATQSSPQVDSPTPVVPDARVALMVRLETKPDQAAAVETLLSGGVEIVDEEAGTPYWFAIKLGPTSYGIFDAFDDDADRQAHLSGKLAAALFAAAPQVLASAPVIEPVDIVGRKFAFATPCHQLSKSLVVRIPAKPEKAAEVAQLIAAGPSIVDGEAGTPVWFGIRIDANTFAIFDAFKTDADRDAHLHGQLAQTLVSRAGELLSAAPTIEPADVLAQKLP